MVLFFSSISTGILRVMEVDVRPLQEYNAAVDDAEPGMGLRWWHPDNNRDQLLAGRSQKL